MEQILKIFQKLAIFGVPPKEMAGGLPLIGLFEGKILVVYTVLSENRLNTIKNNEIWCIHVHQAGRKTSDIDF